MDTKSNQIKPNPNLSQTPNPLFINSRLRVVKRYSYIGSTSSEPKIAVKLQHCLPKKTLTKPFYIHHIPAILLRFQIIVLVFKQLLFQDAFGAKILSTELVIINKTRLSKSRKHKFQKTDTNTQLRENTFLYFLVHIWSSDL